MADDELIFKTKIDESGFVNGTKKIDSSFQGLIAKGKGVMAKLGIATALGSAVKAGLNYNSQMEDYMANFSVLLGDTEKATQKVTELKEMASKTPFGMGDLSEATKQLLAFQVPADDVMNVLGMLGDISLGNKDKLQSLALVFGQVSSAGKLTGQDLMQFINAGFNPLNYIAKRTGESMGELRERMSKGAIGVDEVRQALVDATSAGGQFYQGMEVASKTFTGQMSTLKDNANELLGEVIKPISASLTSELLPSAINAINGLMTAFKEGGITAMLDAGLNMMVKFSEGLVQGIPNLINGALSAMENLGSYLTEQVPIWIQKGFEMLTNFVDGIINALPDMIARIPQIITTFANIINNNMPTIIMKGFQLLIHFVKGIISCIPNLIMAIPQIIQAFVSTLMAFNWLNLGSNLLKNVIHGIRSMISGVGSIAKETGLKMINSLKSFDFVSVGKHMIQGVIDGVKYMAGTAIGAMKNLGASMLNGIKSFFHIKSPSRKMRDEVGKMLPKGIVVGVEDELPKSFAKITKDLDSEFDKLKSSVEMEMSQPKGGSEWDRSQGGTTNNKSYNINQTFINNKRTSPSDMARETENMIRRQEWEV